MLQYRLTMADQTRKEEKNYYGNNRFDEKEGYK